MFRVPFLWGPFRRPQNVTLNYWLPLRVSTVADSKCANWMTRATSWNTLAATLFVAHCVSSPFRGCASLTKNGVVWCTRLINQPIYLPTKNFVSKDLIFHYSKNDFICFIINYRNRIPVSWECFFPEWLYLTCAAVRLRQNEIFPQ